MAANRALPKTFFNLIVAGCDLECRSAMCFTSDRLWRKAALRRQPSANSGKVRAIRFVIWLSARHQRRAGKNLRALQVPSSSVSVRVRKRASAGQARWALKTGQIKLAISPAGCTGCR